MNKKHIGSNFDDFLREENLLENAVVDAKQRIAKNQAKENSGIHIFARKFIERLKSYLHLRSRHFDKLSATPSSAEDK